MLKTLYNLQMRIADGRAVPVVWSRASAYDPFEFFHVPSGVPVSLDTGHTFIELMRG
jgi:hypothetical protein